jgi:DNA-binding NtrC family response regulator
LRYDWPGNVRELQQTITAAAAMATGTELQARDLELGGVTGKESEPIDLAALAGLPLTAAKEKLIEAFERLAIEAALDAHQGNISRAARQLGIHRQSLQQKLTQLDIQRGTGSG